MQQEQPFYLEGSVTPLVGLEPLRKSAGAWWTPTRPLGGWLATYGKIGPDGGIVPTVDRDGQNFQAAGRLGDIDFSEYLLKGLWNDTHDENRIVGRATSLEFHNGTTELSKAHGKVGFWTTGHLFDRSDPQSWDGLDHPPSPVELQRADHFWKLATLLKGTPRPLALSAHGRMLLSPCRQRIIWAEVRQSAVCETPVNPDATLEPLELARKTGIYELLRKGVGGRACGACRCTTPCSALAKADTHSRLLKIFNDRHGVDAHTAERWIASYEAKQRNADVL